MERIKTFESFSLNEANKIKYDYKQWSDTVMTVQSAAGKSKLNYEDGWDALATGIVLYFGEAEGMKLIEEFEKLHKRYMRDTERGA